MTPMAHLDRPPVPQEVIDLVLDEVRHDKPTLMACSLASSASLPSSRRHLYATITFKCHADSEEFHALTEANPVLPTYVRALHIDNIFLEHQFGRSARIPFPAVLPVILKSLCNLRSLRLTADQYVQWAMLDAQQLDMFLDLLATAPLSSITIENFEWPLSSFAQCASLRELVIMHPKNDGDHRQQPELALRWVQLRTINLGCPIDVLPETFGVSYPFLKNFTIMCKSPSDILICRDILESATDTLGTLYLTIEASALSEPLQMRLSALRHFSIVFDPEAGQRALSWLLRFLGSLAAPLLENIFLSMCEDLLTLNDPLWGQFHSLLTQESHFPCLRHVKVHVTLSVEIEDYEDLESRLEDEVEALSLVQEHLVSNSRVEFSVTSPYLEEEYMMGASESSSTSSSRSYSL